MIKFKNIQQFIIRPVIGFVFMTMTGILIAQDTEFWFVAPQLDSRGTAASSNFNRPVYFMITAGDLPAVVTMEMPALSGFTNRVISLAAGASQQIIFGEDYTAFSDRQMDTIQNKILDPVYVGVKDYRGIHFHSTAPVSIYYQVSSINSKDMFSLKGNKALGLEFYTPFQTNTASASTYPDAYPQFHIVATENNTTVDITPTADIVGTTAGTTKTVTLNRGETFAARAAVWMQAGRLTGSHIIADKPVAVSITDDLIGGGGGAYDVVGDQLVPLTNLGTTYIAVRGFTNQNTTDADRLHIVATENNTTISIDGVPVTTINKGVQYVHQMLTALTAVVTANHPVYLFQLSGYGGEYGAVLVPSMYSINSRRISFYKESSSYNHNIFVLVRDGNEGDFTVNGNASTLLATDFTTVPNMSGWKYARKDISPLTAGTVVINNSGGAFSLGYFYTGAAGGASASFGYLSQFGSLSFPDTTYICDGSTITLDGGYALSYLWTLPNGSTLTTSTITVSDTGLYSVVADQDPFLVSASTRVLRRFEGSALISSSADNIGLGTYTYSANPGIYPTTYLKYTWFVDGIQVSSDSLFTISWNAIDEKLITLILQDTVLGCSKTHTLIHRKMPDNISDAQCYDIPPASVWDIKELDRTTALVHAYAQPLVGDFDGCGRNEVIAFNYVSPQTSNSLLVVDDQLQLKYTLSIPPTYLYLAYPISIADVDSDGSAEIYVLTGTTAARTLQCFSFNGTSWIAKPGFTTSTVTLPTTNSVGNIVIGDINGDGIPELFVYDRIINSITGALIATLPAGSKGGYNVYLDGNNTFYPVLADVDNDGMLDIVCGNMVYKAQINNSSTSGTITLAYQAPAGSDIKDGFTSVADIDLDGYLDVVVTHNDNHVSKAYVWSPYKATLLGQTLTGNSAGSVTSRGNISRAFIGDVNNDQYPEIAFSYYNGMVCYQWDTNTNNFIQLWRHPTSDGSGMTTMSMFDFNQDEKQEIIYRDETHLRIIDGETGLNINAIQCYSGTASEMPIVVDLAGDGNAQILVSGSLTSTSPNTNALIRRYVSNTPGAWAPARKVWNQHGYNAVNINEDLTVPRYPINPARVFPNGKRPFNGFLMQQTILNTNGDPLWTLPNIVWETLPTATAAGDSITFTGCITNIGEAALQSPIYVTLYKNDTLPINMPGNILAVDTLQTTLMVDDTLCFTLPVKNICSHAPFTSIWISINDSNGIYPYQQQCEIAGRQEITTILFTDTLSASISASDNNVCAGTAIDFTATVTNGGSLPTYQWKVNGNDITGETNSICTYTPENDDVITCVVTSVNQCVNPNSVTTNGITMIIVPKATPAITIKVRAK